MPHFVYILTNANHKLLYVGMTNDLQHRIQEHKQRVYQGFTAKYNIDKLIYFEVLGSLEKAAMREQQIKKWRREKKIDLIETQNPAWQELQCATAKKLLVKEHILYSSPSDKDPSATLGINLGKHHE